MTKSDLQDLRALMAEAWPAPWVAHTFEIDCPCPNGSHCGDTHSCEEVSAPEAYPDGQCVVQISVPGLESLAAPNAAFIAAARNALPALLDELEQLRAELVRVDDGVAVDGGDLDAVIEVLHDHGIVSADELEQRLADVADVRRETLREVLPVLRDMPRFDSVDGERGAPDGWNILMCPPGEYDDGECVGFASSNNKRLAKSVRRWLRAIKRLPADVRAMLAEAES